MSEVGGRGGVWREAPWNHRHPGLSSRQPTAHMTGHLCHGWTFPLLRVFVGWPVLRGSLWDMTESIPPPPVMALGLHRTDQTRSIKRSLCWLWVSLLTQRATMPT